MSSISENIKQIHKQIPANVTLIAVSKTKPISVIQEAYNTGQQIFVENRTQEIIENYG